MSVSLVELVADTQTGTAREEVLALSLDVLCVT